MGRTFFFFWKNLTNVLKELVYEIFIKAFYEKRKNNSYKKKN